MAETTSTRNKASASGPATAREGRSASGTGPYLSVRYWKRMRPNKVYPVTVSCMGRGESAPVTLRLVMAGAQVVPVEQTINPGNPQEKATFYVTPLAKGALHAEHIEVLENGQKIQELHLPCKVCTQRSAFWWFVLAFFIPWLMLHYFVYSPIGYQAPLGNDGTEQYVRHPNEDYIKKHPDPKSSPTNRITDFVQDNTPNLVPILGDDTDMHKSYKDFQSLPAKVYNELLFSYRDMGQPLAWYVFWLLLLIAAVSYWFNQESRKTVNGRPLPSAGGAE